MLDVRPDALSNPDNKWHKFKVAGLSRRRFPTVSLINDKKFLVLGGLSGAFSAANFVSDAVIVNTQT